MTIGYTVIIFSWIIAQNLNKKYHLHKISNLKLYFQKHRIILTNKNIEQEKNQKTKEINII